MFDDFAWRSVWMPFFFRVLLFLCAHILFVAHWIAIYFSRSYSQFDYSSYQWLWSKLSSAIIFRHIHQFSSLDKMDSCFSIQIVFFFLGRESMHFGGKITLHFRKLIEFTIRHMILHKHEIGHWAAKALQRFLLSGLWRARVVCICRNKDFNSNYSFFFPFVVCVALLSPTICSLNIVIKRDYASICIICCCYFIAFFMPTFRFDLCIIFLCVFRVCCRLQRLWCEKASNPLQLLKCWNCALL